MGHTTFLKVNKLESGILYKAFRFITRWFASSINLGFYTNGFDQLIDVVDSNISFGTNELLNP